MMAPKQVIVRPRIICPETGDVVRLDEYLELVLTDGGKGVIEIVGGPGLGKSTAIAYLSQVLPSDVQLLDDATHDAAIAATASRTGPLIYSTARSYHDVADARLSLAGWGNDELFEYLMAVHPRRCSSVLNRVRALPELALVQGVPELLTIVLDELASAEGNESIRSILDRALMELANDEPLRVQAQSWSFESLVTGKPDGDATNFGLRDERRLSRLLRYRVVQIRFAIEFLK